MLFEIRNSTPEVSPEWTHVRDSFLSGRVRDARQRSLEIARQTPPATAAEYILLIEIARGCSQHRRALAMTRLAHQRFPDEILIQLLQARSLLARGRHWPAIQYLEMREPQVDTLSRTLWATELADLYGDAGFDASCRKWLALAGEMPGADTALPLYNRSCATQGMRQWDEAIELTSRCIEKAPNWIRARAFHINCLLSAGRIQDATTEIEEAQQLGFEDATLESTAAMLAFSLGEFERAERLFRALLNDWPEADFAKWMRRSLCVLLVELGRPDEAREVAEGEEEKLALPKLPDQATGSHKFIPLPLVAQGKNECVPTSVAMAVWPHGKHVDPGRLYREMHGRDGVPLWRMREWAERNQCKVVPVDLSSEAMTRLLDSNILLIGVLEGAFNSHVEVVCGYHEDLDVFYVRDPGHWVPIVYPKEMALKRYELHGGLLAVIPTTDEVALSLAREFQNDESLALIDLAEAVFHGEREKAEQAHHQIADDSKVAFMRDGHSLCVVISPSSYSERMAVLAEDEDANQVARFRAMLSLGSEEAQKVLDQLLSKDEARLGTRVRRYMKLMRHMHDGRWKEARKLIDVTLVTGGSIAQMWELKSDILSELGDQAGCTAALDRAIELEPLRLSLHKKSLDRRANQLTFKEYLAEYEELRTSDPDERRLLWGLAMALQDGPDGARHEETMREYMHWFPRDPSAYSQLLFWYGLQGRQDLSDALLAEARNLLPDEYGDDDAPVVDGNQGANQDVGNSKNGDQVEPIVEEASEPLPESHSELIDIAFNTVDDRRNIALSKLTDLESENRLTWHERSRLLSCRLVVGDDAQILTAETAAAMLPDSPPGAAHWFADVVAEIVTSYDPPIGVPSAINEWIEQQVPNYQNYVGLWFNRVLLYETSRDLERALQELERLLEKYPTYSSALYRMGVVKRSQRDYRSAEHYLRKALAVNPGLPGAFEVLRSVYEGTDNLAGALECIRMQRRKYPHDFNHLKDEVFTVCDLESTESAAELLDQTVDGFPQRRLQILRARVELRDGLLNDVRLQMANIKVRKDEADEDLYEDHLQLRLGYALKNDDTNAVIAACTDGLDRWPHWTRLQEIRAERISRRDPKQGRKLLRKVLCEGNPEAHTAWQYLQLAESVADIEARKVILAASEDRRLGLVELFSQVMSESDYVRWNGPFLEWANEQFPDSQTIERRLTTHYNVAHQFEKAVEIAQRIYDRDPDSPENVGLLGQCLLELDAEKALPYLERVCELNRSVNVLFDLARCYHFLNRLDQARKVHWEILENNQYHAASWTNLYILSAPHEKLWSFVGPILKLGGAVEDEYALVAMVFVAKSIKKQLPREWFALADRRLQILATHPGYADEPVRLRRAFQAWQTVRPDDKADSALTKPGLWSRIVARIRWPGVRWVPKD